MALLRGILFAISFYSGTVFYVLMTFPVSLLGPKRLRGWVRLWARHHRLSARYILGVRSRLDGVPPGGSVLYALKHQSMYETVEILLLLDEPVVVLKKELADIPIWGWVIRQYGVIPVDRAGGGAALRRMMRSAEKAIAEGRSVAIFPEGTRVPPGEQPPLQSGFAGLYRMLKLPVVPVAVDSGRLWPRGQLVKKPGIVTFQVEETIPPGLPRAEIESRVHEAINRLDVKS